MTDSSTADAPDPDAPEPDPTVDSVDPAASEPGADAAVDPVDEPADEVTPEAGISRSTRSALEWGAVIVGALVVALVVKTFLFQAFYIPSGSMIPTLEIGDRVLVNKLSYEWGDVERGDVIVFDRPGGPGPDGISELIKRVIALPGETVEAHDNQVFINGEPLEEPYLPEGTVNRDFGPEVVPEGRLWMMGDNRTNSEDSRKFNSIPIDSVVGRAFVVIWPPGDIGGL